MGACLALAFAVTIDDELIYRFGFRPEFPQAKAFLTHVFLHSNLVHLLGNMVFLAAVGPAVEAVAGKVRFGLTFFLAAFAGVLAYWGVAAGVDTPAPYIGASSAVAGLVGYAAVRFFSLRVPVAPRVKMPVVAVALVWVGLQALGALLAGTQLGGTGGTSYVAHLAGFTTGVVLAFALGASGEAFRVRQQTYMASFSDRSAGAVLAIAERQLIADPLDEGAAKHKAEALADLHDPAARIELALKWWHRGDTVYWLSILQEEQALSQLTVQERQRWATAHPATRGQSLPLELRQALLESVVVESPESPDAANAAVELMALRPQDTDVRERMTALLREHHPMHPATELARSRGWIS